MMNDEFLIAELVLVRRYGASVTPGETGDSSDKPLFQDNKVAQKFHPESSMVCQKTIKVTTLLKKP